MDTEWQPCPKCWRFLIPYENGKSTLVCYGPTFKFGSRSRSTLRRYGTLQWLHITPQFAIEADIHNMNPDPDSQGPLDIRVVNHVRSWLAWHAPRPRKLLSKAAMFSSSGEHVDIDPEDYDFGEDN